jgi:hypothetical protein
MEAQLGVVPGYYLSKSAQNAGGGAIMPQLSVLFDPDRWLGLPGLIVGGRIYGQDRDTPGEPMIGYRYAFDDGLSVAAIGFGTSKSSTRQLASYRATHLGGELAIDARLLTGGSWFELHWQLAASATYITAHGRYCANPSGVAVDCDPSDTAKNSFIDRDLEVMSAAATSTLGFDLFRSAHHLFHGARIGWQLAAGTMPLIEPDGRTSRTVYWSTGLALMMALGATSSTP